MTDVSVAQDEYTKVFLRDLAIEMFIGIHDHEKSTKQRVIVNVELTLKSKPDAVADHIDQTVSYEEIATLIRKIAASGHINLVETFAEKIAQLCLKNSETINVRVCVEKPQIIRDSVSAGVDILRKR